MIKRRTDIQELPNTILIPSDFRTNLNDEISRTGRLIESVFLRPSEDNPIPDGLTGPIAYEILRGSRARAPQEWLDWITSTYGSLPNGPDATSKPRHLRVRGGPSYGGRSFKL